MVFKKNKVKKKAKSKSKSKKGGGAKDSWNYEGGFNVQDIGSSDHPTDNDGSNSSNTRPKRKSTQDRDESIRRSKARQFNKRLKSDFKKKMAHKVRFEDVLRGVDDDDDDDSMDVDDESNERKTMLEYTPNPIPAYERVRQSLLQSKGYRDNDQLIRSFLDSIDNGDTHHHQDRNAASNDDADNKRKKNLEIGAIDKSSDKDNSNNNNSMGHENITTTVNDHDIDLDNEDDDDAENIHADNDALGPSDLYFDSFFHSDEATAALSDASSSSTGTKKTGSLQKIADTPYEVLGTLDVPHCSDSDLSRPIPCLKMVPHAHKLFSSRDDVTFSTIGSSALPYVLSYADAFIDGRNANNDGDLLLPLLVHATNHIVKARAKVVKHNQKLKKKLHDTILDRAVTHEENKSIGKRASRRKKASMLDSGTTADPTSMMMTTMTTMMMMEAANDNNLQMIKADVGCLSLRDDPQQDDSSIYRDQGFTRPRLLILCPFRGSALAIIKTLKAVLGEHNTSISGWDKLLEEYATPELEEGVGVGRGDASSSSSSSSRKPPDWQQLFGQNIDDDFKIGIQINPGHGKGSGSSKGVYMRLFSDFFISDIIIASPLGLRLAIGAKSKPKSTTTTTTTGRDNNSNNDKSDVLSPDFLSSIEMVLLHQADVMYMQNWEHVDFVMRLANKLPSTSRETTDYSRVRQYFLDGKAAQHRQLLMTSAFNTPELQAFYREYASSKHGQVRFKKHHGEGCIGKVVISVKQVFQRIPGIKSFTSQEDTRFGYFKEQVLAPLLRLQQSHTLIITPSYFDFVRVRNELLHQEANAAYICEYSRDSEISRGRSRFYHGTKHILLYSGRAHFFRRYHIRGAKHIIFYSLPEYAQFYAEYVNMLTEAAVPSSGVDSSIDDDLAMEGMSCLVLFTQYEKMALERIVGSRRCAHILGSKKTTFMFC